MCTSSSAGGHVHKKSYIHLSLQHEFLSPLLYEALVLTLRVSIFTTSNILWRATKIELYEARLDENIKFQALSYTWGDLKNRINVRVDGSTLTITPSLYGFLSELRRAGSRDEDQNPISYWADQLCINQADVPERNMQVAMMADIYRRSQKTLVWLGESASPENLALEMLCNIDDLGYTMKVAPTLMLPHVAETIAPHLRSESGEQVQCELRGLLDRPWAWVVQEVAIATECVVHVPGKSFRWETFDLAIIGISWIDKKARGSLRGSWVLRTKAAATIRHIQHCKKIWVSRNSAQERDDFLQLLRRLGPTMECSDPRDRVYAFLSLKPDSFCLQPKYGLSVEDVFVQTSAALAAQSESLDIFAYTRYPPIGENSAISTVPSWAIDWRLPSTMSRLDVTSKSTFCASGKFSYKAGPSSPLSYKMLTIHTGTGTRL
ncbi:hypothetical protein GQ53DRAFT_767499 [Thozetella sp. PMI_491]|nr:hypothetical protein GQ53DRAFT_767499 [Thozetella sp. PMI_491]